MASKPHRITEADVGIAVLQILAERDSGEATVRHLKKRLPEFLKLSASDREDSETRTNEELWEQQVRNIRSHKNNPGNPFFEGFVDSVVRGRWRITKAGLLHLQHKGLI